MLWMLKKFFNVNSHPIDDLDKILPPTSRRGGAREKKKEEVLEKIRNIVEVYVGI